MNPKIAKRRFEYRKQRVRNRIYDLRDPRPRLCVSRTMKHIYAQIVDDTAQKTLVAASTLSAELKTGLKNSSNIKAAQAVGELVAKKAKTKGISKVVFDRSGYIYHGRIKALADSARSNGLDF